MPLTIQCIHCGVVLNVPANSAGRRLKCPKCGERFQISQGGVDASPLADDASHPAQNPSASLLLSRLASASQLPTMPTTDGGDLRESFDLPMMTGSAPAASKSSTAPTGGEAADAMGLFGEAPAPRRKKTGAEARAQARRCPTCNAVVPAGMSLCQSCGLDLESGTRVSLVDDLAPPPPPAPTGLPIAPTVVGGLCLATSVALTAMAFFKWNAGTYFVPLGFFGVYASVQFLRAKTVKLLLVALTLGAVLDLVFMIGSPILQASNETAPIERKIKIEDDPEIEGVMIKPFAERLDMDSVTRGIGLMVLYAGVSIYLISPQVGRHMRK